MERLHLKRRLTAVLLADVVGYSRLMNVDEEGTHIRLADCVKNLIEPTIALHEGRLVRSKGDGLLVEFDSAVNAVNCAVDIQSSLAARNDSTAGDRKLELRIGINSGDVIVDENDIYGNSVNIAARLEGLAEPGGIYVTSAVREQLLAHPGLYFEDTGDRWVKNFDRPIRVYRVISEPAEESGSSLDVPRKFGYRFAGRAFRSSRVTIFGVGGAVAIAATIGITKLSVWDQTPLLSARVSIMVLPFRNLNEPSEDYFADAVTDDLTTDLSRLSDTMVIARATAFTYKGQPVDARTIRGKFGVRYVLAGSIEKIGTRVRANVELVDTSSASSLWAERFQSELTDPFELQEAVTGRIAASLHLQLLRAEHRRSIIERTTDPDAYEMRLRAMAYLIDKITPENTLAARRDLEKSVALDPYSAQAWSELAYVYALDHVNGWNHATKELIVKADQYVQKAYTLDRSVAIAHVAEGWLRRVEGNHQGAVAAFDEALRLDPNLTTAFAEKANELIYLGRAKEAPALITKAIDLSPRDPELGKFYSIMGRAYFHIKDYDDAIHWLQKSVQERPKTWFTRAYLISAYALTGRHGQNEMQAAVNEYNDKIKDPTWPLDPNIKDFYARKQFDNTHPEFKAMIKEMLNGLQFAKETARFP
jgi:class 3 adenylate cyclase/TolB-like protein/Flp pilus assembly protein TadD